MSTSDLASKAGEEVQQEADLYFAPTHAPQGFTNFAMSHFDGGAEPVIRELLQNSVDAADKVKAADKVGRRCEVVFVIREVAKDQLPGWETYLRVFETAVDERENKRVDRPATHDEQTIIDRIRNLLDTPTIPLLMCIDNGTGIGPERMQSLLTSGNSDKGEGGAGSFGLGHHAAFSASDLRYVLYASRYRDSSDELRSLASGHAVLATHEPMPDVGPQIIASDGYWVLNEQRETLFTSKGLTSEGHPYPTAIPEVFDQALSNMDDSGLAVCVTGFNDFRRDEDDPTVVDSIAFVAASNFCDAVWRDKLTVRISDEVSGGGICLDRENLRQVLMPHKDKNKGRAPKKGQIAGADAYRACVTLCEGNLIDTSFDDGVRVMIRTNLEHGEPTRVHVFRKGMWITSRGNELTPAAFTDYLPFDAVVSLRDGDLESLVRNAEGIEHRGIDTKRLAVNERKKLRELLKKLANDIRNAAIPKQYDEEVVLDDFALLHGEATRQVETVTSRRSGGGGSRRAPQPREDDRGKKRKGASVRKSTKARSGSSARFRWAPVQGSDDRNVSVVMMLNDEQLEGKRLGLRLSVPNGSDETCDSPLPTRFLNLRSVTCNDKELARASGSNGAQELVVEPPDGERCLLKFALAGSVPDAQLAELDIVRRNPTDEGSSAAEVETPATSSTEQPE